LTGEYVAFQATRSCFM